MEYRRLGRSGLQVSALSFGSWVTFGSRLTLDGYEWLRSRYEAAEARGDLDRVRRLAEVADGLGCSRAQLAIAWCLANPNVSTVITGASRPEQVTENMEALDVASRLEPGVLDRIEDILGNRPEPPTDWRDPS